MMVRRILITLTLTLAAVAWPRAADATDASSAAASRPAASTDSLQADFNSDGFADLAVGVPAEDVGAIEDAGAVNVQYGSATGLTSTPGQLFTQSVGSGPEAGDLFGDSLATGDFNRDGFPDLAIGADGEDVGLGAPDAGAVTVLYGSDTGLSNNGAQLFTQPVSRPEPGDGFGFALTSGDFNGDGAADLAVGAPFETGVGTPASGAVNVLYGSATNRLSTAGAQLFTQKGSPAETGDSFGFSLATGDVYVDGSDDLAVGAPFEDVGAVVDAGAVNVFYSSAAGVTNFAQIFTQRTGSAPEADDQFGFSVAMGDFEGPGAAGSAELAVGAPGESVGNIRFAGAVSVLYSAGSVLGSLAQLFTQLGSAPEPGDEFGWSVTTGDFNSNGSEDLAVGAPFENGVGTSAQGAVSVIYGTAGGLSTTNAQFFVQQVGSAPETDDLFGWSLASGEFNGNGFTDLAISAPGEGVGTIPFAGAVSWLNGSANRLTASGGQLFHQDSPNVGSFAEAGDFFGAALAAANAPAVTTAGADSGGSAGATTSVGSIPLRSGWVGRLGPAAR